MKIVPASFRIEERNEKRGGIDIIELAGRTCYKSEAKAGMGKGDRFVKSLIEKRHDAMLEHGDYIFQVDDRHILDSVSESLRIMRERTGTSPMLQITNVRRRAIISGNIRAWRELLMSVSFAGCYFSGHMDPVYTNDIRERLDGWFNEDPDPRVHLIGYGDLKGCAEKLTHERMTVRFTVDRGVSHEIVRHRLFSFAQESTRYCNYSNERFGKEITVIEPCYLEKDSQVYHNWKDLCGCAEHFYFQMLDNGCTPQEARAVLPTSLKTELVVTGNLREWQHFFSLRALETTGKAHPQMVEVARPLYELSRQIYPDVIA